MGLSTVLDSKTQQHNVTFAEFDLYDRRFIDDQVPASDPPALKEYGI